MRTHTTNALALPCAHALWVCASWCSAARSYRLRGRKLTSREPELVTGATMQQRGAVAATGDVAEMQLDDALDAHERPAGCARSVAFASELTGLYWLDAIVVMLSLGTMSILANGACVTSEAIATAFLLAARCVGDGKRVEVRPLADEEAAAGVPPDGATATASLSAGASSEGNALGLRAVLPAAQAHWVVLADDGLPALAVVNMLRGLQADVTSRVAHLIRVLDRHSVPLVLRDASNLVCGLVNVRPTSMAKGKLTHSRRDADVQAWLPPALLQTAQPLLEGCVADVPGLLVELLAVGPAPPDGVSAARDTVDAPAVLAMAMSAGDVLREADVWLDWRKDGVHKKDRATYHLEVARHEWPVRSVDVREYLNFAIANGAMHLVDAAASVLARGVLHAYVDWVCDPAGRLHQLCQQHTKTSLRGSVHEAYRLPTEVFVTSVWHLLTHLRDLDAAAAVVGGDGRFHFVDSGGHVKSVADARPSAKTLRKAKSNLNVHGKAFGLCDSVISAKEIDQAYELSLRELNRAPRMCTPPLYRSIAHALVENLDVSTHRWLRLALWVRLATRLMVRSYEGISLLHADLVLDRTNLAFGEWQVGAFTKTTDGIYGCVPGWDHVRGCLLAGLTMVQLLRVDRVRLREAAFGSTSATVCSCERGCLVCLTVFARREGVDESQGLTPVFQSLDKGGRFDGGSALVGTCAARRKVHSCVRLCCVPTHVGVCVRQWPLPTSSLPTFASACELLSNTATHSRFPHCRALATWTMWPSGGCILRDMAASVNTSSTGTSSSSGCRCSHASL